MIKASELWSLRSAAHGAHEAIGLAVRLPRADGISGIGEPASVRKGRNRVARIFGGFEFITGPSVMPTCFARYLRSAHPQDSAVASLRSLARLAHQGGLNPTRTYTQSSEL